MAKRFTDTDKYKKPFIRGLRGAYKLLWDYLYHDCDHAGIWIVDFEIAQIRIGKDMPVNEIDALVNFNHNEERIVVFDAKSKWFIVPFVSFQYGELNPANRAHKSVILKLEKNNLTHHTKALTKALQGCKDKDKDKDMVKDKEGILSVFDTATFFDFFDEYPKRIERDDAELAWNEQPEEYHPAIVQSAKNWAAHWANERTEMKWIKNPATFIRKGTWKTPPPNGDIDKDCVLCKAPYKSGVGPHKYLEKDGKKEYRCFDCRMKEKKGLR